MSTGGSWPGISSDVNSYLLDLVAGNLDLAKPTEIKRRVSGIGTPKLAAITDKRVPSSFPTQGREVKVYKRINWLKNTRAKRFVAAMIGACLLRALILFYEAVLSIEIEHNTEITLAVPFSRVLIHGFSICLNRSQFYKQFKVVRKNEP